MGSNIEFNDTLNITTEQGFPKGLTLEDHVGRKLNLDDFVGKTFSFKKSDQRLYHLPPTRCFLVHNIEGNWLYWGEIQMLSQTIDSREKTTSGEYQITRIYDPEYMKTKTQVESPEGKSFF